jgi:hypothetical protein
VYVEVGGKELGRIENVRGCFIGLEPDTEAVSGFGTAGYITNYGPRWSGNAAIFTL